MAKNIFGYTVVVVVFLVSLLLSHQFGLWAPVVGAAVSVVAGYLAGRIGAIGITVVFLILSVAFPVGVLYLIGANVGYGAPLHKLFEESEWINFFYPVLSALVCYALLVLIRSRKESPRPSGE
jgi:hypothetical protein